MTLRWLALVILLGPAPAHAAKPDAFLDQPVPRDLLPPPPSNQPAQNGYMLAFDSYSARMEYLRAALPCPVTFPEGLNAFVREKELGTDWTKGKTFFISERNGVGFPVGSTFRDLLAASCQNLHLSWTYNPARKVIATDFSWHIHAAPSAMQLLAYMNTHKPTSRDWAANDPWKVAFHALLSRPENFPRVWRLRFAADDRMLFGLPSNTNLTFGKITDAQGVPYFLIVNSQAEMFNPGPPGSFSYYLFDPMGRFQSGGIYTVGYRCSSDSAWLDPDGHRLWVQTFNNGSQKREMIFDVEKGQLVRKSSLVDGQKTRNEWPWTDMDLGKSVFDVGP